MIVANNPKEFDRLTLVVPEHRVRLHHSQVRRALVITAQGAGSTHTVTVAGQSYTYTEQSGDANAGVAAGLAAAMTDCADVMVVRGDGTAELGPVNQLNVRARRTDGLRSMSRFGDRCLP